MTAPDRYRVLEIERRGSYSLGTPFTKRLRERKVPARADFFFGQETFNFPTQRGCRCYKGTNRTPFGAIAAAAISTLAEASRAFVTEPLYVPNSTRPKLKRL